MTKTQQSRTARARKKPAYPLPLEQLRPTTFKSALLDGQENIHLNIVGRTDLVSAKMLRDWLTEAIKYKEFKS